MIVEVPLLPNPFGVLQALPDLRLGMRMAGFQSSFQLLQGGVEENSYGLGPARFGLLDGAQIYKA